MPRKEDTIRRTARYHGKQYEATGKTPREAERKLAEKLAAARRGEDVTGGSMTVDAWFRKWLELYKTPKGLTGKSLGMYEEKYRLYIKPRIGHLRLRDVRDVHLQAILNDQAGMSVSHLAKLRGVMQQMFRRARQSRLIAWDPAELLELPTTTKGARRAITEEERAAILEVAKTHRAGLWVLTLLYTGMRPGESAALNWADVDFRNNEIHVHAAVESGTTALKSPKTAAGVRDIPIHRALRPLLEAAAVGQEPFSPVFAGRKGGRCNAVMLWRMWRDFREDVAACMGVEDVPDLVLYCLRHTFCTDLQRAGVPINVAKELMGHSNIQTTANIYTHKDAGTLHAGIALLDGGKVGESGGNGAGTGAGTGV